MKRPAAKKPQRKKRRPPGLVCAQPDCGAKLTPPAGRGARPKWCPRHKPAGNRARDLRRAVASGDPEATVAHAKLGYADVPPAEASAFAVSQRFAVFLGLTGGNAAEAAQLAGVAPSGPELAALVARANGEHAELVGRKMGALAELATATGLLLLLRLRDVAPVLPPNQVAPALKQLADVQERLLGGVSPVYSTIEVVLKRPERTP